MLMHAHPRTGRGFTLIDLAGALALLAVIGVGLAVWKEGFLRDAQARRTAEGFVLIQEALYSYRLNPLHGYVWPAAITDLDPYLPNFAAGGRNGIGQPYSLDPPPPPVSPTDGIVIQTDMLTAEAATDVARLFPLNGAVSGTLVRIGVPVPGHEQARNAVLARDGNKAMLGSLDMDGHDIENLANVEARHVNVDGAVNALSLASDSLSISGEEMLLNGVRLTDDAVGFLNRLAALNCGTAQRVRVSSSTPTCVSVTTPATTTTTTPPPQPVQTAYESCVAGGGFVFERTTSLWSCSNYSSGPGRMGCTSSQNNCSRQGR